MTVIIIIVGLVSYISIPERISSVNYNSEYIVSTAYFGVSPQDIESLVSQEIRERSERIKDVKKVTISQESFSFVNIEFNPDVKIDEALQKVRDKVSIAKTKCERYRRAECYGN
ncbi:MAG: efflux RND transporter permease subunit [Ignavibacteria bacterium]|nr:efflux RND transporter permease subunit [Ignavibacteria bacterium]